MILAIATGAVIGAGVVLLWVLVRAIRTERAGLDAFKAEIHDLVSKRFREPRGPRLVQTNLPLEAQSSPTPERASDRPRAPRTNFDPPMQAIPMRKSRIATILAENARKEAVAVMEKG